VRIFDDEFASALQDQFSFKAMSATGRAAPAFAAAAAGVDMTRPITVEGEELSLASMVIQQNSGILGITVGELESDYDVSVVLLRRQGQTPDYHPASSRQIKAHDTLAVLGGSSQISVLAQKNSQ
jgi:voltage-gated potassium channel